MNKLLDILEEELTQGKRTPEHEKLYRIGHIDARGGRQRRWIGNDLVQHPSPESHQGCEATQSGTLMTPEWADVSAWP